MASSHLSTTATNASNKIALINEFLTGPPAEELLKRSMPLEKLDQSSKQLHILDNASGIGTLIFRLLSLDVHNHIDKIVGADIDEGYLAFLRQRANASSQSSKIETRRLDQQAPGLENDSFDYIFNNFGVFFAAKDDAVLQETHRMLKSGGTAGFTSWAKISWWDEILLPALKRNAPDARPLPHPAGLFPAKGWMETESARAKLESAGYVDVQSATWDFTPDVDPGEFALACAHLVKTISARVWDAEARERYEPVIEKAFGHYVQETFPNGRWNGKMAAVLTWGRKA